MVDSTTSRTNLVHSRISLDLFLSVIDEMQSVSITAAAAANNSGHNQHTQKQQQQQHTLNMSGSRFYLESLSNMDSLISDVHEILHSSTVNPKAICLDGNNLTSLHPIHTSLPGLKAITALHNRLYFLCPTPASPALNSWPTPMNRLCTLDLSFNLLEEIPDLRSMPKLQTLMLQHNKIHSLAALANGHHLKLVDLSANLLTFATDAEFVDAAAVCMRSLTQLKELRLADNPFVNEIPRYALLIVQQVRIGSKLALLSLIDGVAVDKHLRSLADSLRIPTITSSSTADEQSSAISINNQKNERNITTESKESALGLKLVDELDERLANTQGRWSYAAAINTNNNLREFQNESNAGGGGTVAGNPVIPTVHDLNATLDRCLSDPSQSIEHVQVLLSQVQEIIDAPPLLQAVMFNHFPLSIPQQSVGADRDAFINNCSDDFLQNIALLSQRQPQLLESLLRVLAYLSSVASFGFGLRCLEQLQDFMDSGELNRGHVEDVIQRHLIPMLRDTKQLGHDANDGVQQGSLRAALVRNLTVIAEVSERPLILSGLVPSLCAWAVSVSDHKCDSTPPSDDVWRLAAVASTWPPNAVIMGDHHFADLVATEFMQCTTFTPRYVLLVETFTNLCENDIVHQNGTSEIGRPNNVVSATAYAPNGSNNNSDGVGTKVKFKDIPSDTQHNNKQANVKERHNVSGGKESAEDVARRAVAAVEAEGNSGDVGNTGNSSNSNTKYASTNKNGMVLFHRSASVFVQQKQVLTKLISDLRDMVGSTPTNTQTQRHHVTSRCVLALASVCRFRKGFKRLVTPPTSKLSFMYLLAQLMSTPSLPSNVLKAVLEGYLALLRVPPEWFPIHFEEPNGSVSGSSVLGRDEFIEEITNQLQGVVPLLQFLGEQGTRYAQVCLRVFNNNSNSSNNNNNNNNNQTDDENSAHMDGIALKLAQQHNPIVLSFLVVVIDIIAHYCHEANNEMSNNNKHTLNDATMRLHDNIANPTTSSCSSSNTRRKSIFGNSESMFGRIASALNMADRERYLFACLSTPSDQVRLAVVRCLLQVPVAELDVREVAVVVTLLKNETNISSGRNEEVLGGAIQLLTKLCVSRLHTGREFRSTHAMETAHATLDILHRNEARDTNGQDEETAQKGILSNACVYFLKAASAFPGLQRTLRGHEVMAQVTAVLRLEDASAGERTPRMFTQTKQDTHQQQQQQQHEHEPVLVEQTWPGRQVEYLMQTLVGDTRLSPLGKVVPRIVRRIADVLMGVQDPSRACFAAFIERVRDGEDNCDGGGKGRGRGRGGCARPWEADPDSSTLDIQHVSLVREQRMFAGLSGGCGAGMIRGDGGGLWDSSSGAGGPKHLRSETFTQVLDRMQQHRIILHFQGVDRLLLFLANFVDVWAFSFEQSVLPKATFTSADNKTSTHGNNDGGSLPAGSSVRGKRGETVAKLLKAFVVEDVAELARVHVANFVAAERVLANAEQSAKTTANFANTDATTDNRCNSHPSRSNSFNSNGHHERETGRQVLLRTFMASGSSGTSHHSTASRDNNTNTSDNSNAEGEDNLDWQWFLSRRSQMSKADLPSSKSSSLPPSSRVATATAPAPADSTESEFTQVLCASLRIFFALVQMGSQDSCRATIAMLRVPSKLRLVVCLMMGPQGCPFWHQSLIGAKLMWLCYAICEIPPVRRLEAAQVLNTYTIVSKTAHRMLTALDAKLTADGMLVGDDVVIAMSAVRTVALLASQLEHVSLAAISASVRTRRAAVHAAWNALWPDPTVNMQQVVRLFLFANKAQRFAVPPPTTHDGVPSASTSDAKTHDYEGIDRGNKWTHESSIDELEDESWVLEQLIKACVQFLVSYIGQGAVQRFQVLHHLAIAEIIHGIPVRQSVIHTILASASKHAYQSWLERAFFGDENTSGNYNISNHTRRGTTQRGGFASTSSVVPPRSSLLMMCIGPRQKSKYQKEKKIKEQQKCMLGGKEDGRSSSSSCGGDWLVEAPPAPPLSDIIRPNQREEEQRGGGDGSGSGSDAGSAHGGGGIASRIWWYNERLGNERIVETAWVDVFTNDVNVDVAEDNCNSTSNTVEGPVRRLLALTSEAYYLFQNDMSTSASKSGRRNAAFGDDSCFSDALSWEGHSPTHGFELLSALDFGDDDVASAANADSAVPQLVWRRPYRALERMTVGLQGQTLHLLHRFFDSSMQRGQVEVLTAVTYVQNKADALHRAFVRLTRAWAAIDLSLGAGSDSVKVPPAESDLLTQHNVSDAVSQLHSRLGLPPASRHTSIYGGPLVSDVLFLQRNHERKQRTIILTDTCFGVARCDWSNWRFLPSLTKNRSTENDDEGWGHDDDDDNDHDAADEYANYDDDINNSISVVLRLLSGTDACKSLSTLMELSFESGQEPVMVLGFGDHDDIPSADVSSSINSRKLGGGRGDQPQPQPLSLTYFRMAFYDDQTRERWRRQLLRHLDHGDQ